MKNLDRSVTEYYQKQQLEPAVLEAILREGDEIRRDLRKPSLKSNGDISYGSSIRAAKVWMPALAAAVLMLILTPLFWDNFNAKRDQLTPSEEIQTVASNASLATVSEQNAIVASTLDTFEKNKLSDIVMREASLNHKSQLQLDFETNDFQKLGQFMEQLDFELELPARFLPVSVAREGRSSHETGAKSLVETSRTKRLQLAGGRYCTVAGNLAAHVKLQDSSHADVSLFVTPHSVDFESVSNQAAKYEDGIQVSSWNENGLFYLLVTQP